MLAAISESIIGIITVPESDADANNPLHEKRNEHNGAKHTKAHKEADAVNHRKGSVFEQTIGKIGSVVDSIRTNQIRKQRLARTCQ